MAQLKQYGILVVAVLIGGGFAFGGIASYAGLTSSSTSDRESINLTVPQQNYQEKPYEMGLREQRAVAYRNDIVFVNAFYETQQQKRQLQQLEQVANSFGGRAYVSVANSSSNSDLMITYGLVEFPAVVVVGGGGSSQPANASVHAVSEAVCSNFRNLGDQAARCL